MQYIYITIVFLLFSIYVNGVASGLCHTASQIMYIIDFITLLLQKLLYSPHADTLTVWWTGFNDPESGIKSTQIRLLDGGESCQSRSIGDMTTVIDFIEISTNSS